jgi:hypothetical protein
MHDLGLLFLELSPQDFSLLLPHPGGIEWMAPGFLSPALVWKWFYECPIQLNWRGADNNQLRTTTRTAKSLIHDGRSADGNIRVAFGTGSDHHR